MLLVIGAVGVSNSSPCGRAKLGGQLGIRSPCAAHMRGVAAKGQGGMVVLAVGAWVESAVPSGGGV